MINDGYHVFPCFFSKNSRASLIVRRHDTAAPPGPQEEEGKAKVAVAAISWLMGT